ncbi:unannotated protein [freshwater metagenome]|uniref:Unannotated protein n=1 Tax=freshwater metagenome TaxID=449393 RepID=A0A6J7D069_9ZZZZ
MTGWILLIASPVPLHAHSDGVFIIHEVEQDMAPKVSLEVEKDLTGGFNVHVVTSNFRWRPEMASKRHVIGEGHAHVYLDGQKIMRIYNEWFHLNTYQFATRSGEQLFSVEFVGNDHAPYTIQGVPLGAEQIITVPGDEIQPASGKKIEIQIVLIALLVIFLGGLFFWDRRTQTT